MVYLYEISTRITLYDYPTRFIQSATCFSDSVSSHGHTLVYSFITIKNVANENRCK